MSKIMPSQICHQLEFLNNISVIVVSGLNRSKFCEDLIKFTLFFLAQKRAGFHLINGYVLLYYLRVDSSTLMSLPCPADVIDSFSVRYSQRILKRKKGVWITKIFTFFQIERYSFILFCFYAGPSNSHFLSYSSPYQGLHNNSQLLALYRRL